LRNQFPIFEDDLEVWVRILVEDMAKKLKLKTTWRTSGISCCVEVWRDVAVVVLGPCRQQLIEECLGREHLIFDGLDRDGGPVKFRSADPPATRFICS
jgi:hypothetical protein